MMCVNMKERYLHFQIDRLGYNAMLNIFASFNMLTVQVGWEITSRDDNVDIAR